MRPVTKKSTKNDNCQCKVVVAQCCSKSSKVVAGCHD